MPLICFEVKRKEKTAILIEIYCTLSPESGSNLVQPTVKRKPLIPLNHASPARISKNQIPFIYSWIAPTHDILATLVESRARRRAIQLAKVADGEHVLEVAVGTGLNYQHLIRQNTKGHTTGIDLTPAMLRKAQKRVSRIIKKHQLPRDHFTLDLGDAYALNFPDNQFDLVFNSYMFDMLPEEHFFPVLKEFKRVLKPGGRLVQMNMTHGRCWYNHLWEGIYRLHPALLGGCRSITTEPALHKAGFVNIHREYISQWTFPSEVLQGMNPLTT